MEKRNSLLKRRQELLQQITGLTDVLWGNVLERFTTCSRPGCRCHRGQLHGPRYYLVRTIEGKQKQLYISVRHAQTVKRGARQREELEEILREVTDINLELMESEDGNNIQP